ncbi:MAG: LamG domain-containing protein [bacterium]
MRHTSFVPLLVAAFLFALPSAALAAEPPYALSLFAAGTTSPSQQKIVTDVIPSSLTIDWNTGNVHLLNLITSDIGLAFGGAQPGSEYKLILNQDASGNRTVAWPGSILWLGGEAPTLSAAAGSADVFTFLYDGARYLGSYALGYGAPKPASTSGRIITHHSSHHSSGGGSSGGNDDENDDDEGDGGGNDEPDTPPDDTPPAPVPAAYSDGSLVSYWKLDETGGDAIDSVGGNTLANNGTVYAPGLVHNAARITGAGRAGHYFTADDLTQNGLDVTGDMTLACWVKFGSQPPDMYPILAKWGGPSDANSYRLAYANAGGTGALFFGTNGSSNEQVTIPQTLSDGAWYYIAATASGTTGTIYVNGAGIGTGTVAETKNDSSTAFGLGYQAGGNISGDQLQDECGVWSRALTAGEIAELYNGGAGNQYPE